MIEDLAGKKFGKLTAIGFTGGRVGRLYRYTWECLCSCGNSHNVQSSHLKSGVIKDCGCGRRSRNGCTSSPLFKTWSNFVRRCTDPANKSYRDYGGRGIKVSERWMNPEVFILDMAPRPGGTTLERVDNSGPYSVENCVWADRTTQANNKRNVPKHEYAGNSKSVAQWAREYGIPAETLRSRLKAGENHVTGGVAEGASLAPRPGFGRTTPKKKDSKMEELKLLVEMVASIGFERLSTTRSRRTGVLNA